MKLNIYNQEGKKVDEIKLNPKIFDVEPKENVIHQVVVAMLANKRVSWAHTKTKGEVRGGGRKPWRQKGTGRARVGSIRSPLWPGGGITFGPRKNRNYKQKVNKKVRRLAFLMCLSDKIKNKKLYVLDKLKINKIKTKNFVKILMNIFHKNKISKENKEKIILVLDKKDDKIIKSSRNIPNIKPTLIDNLNIIDLLKADYLLTTIEVIKIMQKRFELYKKKAHK